MKGTRDDYLDAINDDTPGTRDVLDCGKGFDRTPSPRSGDKVADNCERKIACQLTLRSRRGRALAGRI